MKFAFTFLSTLAAASTAQDDSEFMKFAVKYNKSYSTTKEFSQRKENWNVARG